MKLEYTRKVNFSTTDNYGNVDDDEDDVYTIDEFKQNCKSGLFIDYDGFGYPVKENKACTTFIVRPSKHEEIPEEATHIIWFNK